MQQRRLYDTIPETLNSYKVIGMSTPNSWDLKCKMLSSYNDEETAIIVFDAFRCSSTLLACFSSGIVGAMVMEKGLDSGTTIEQALKFSKSKSLELIYGGELHGSPVVGGIVGNSPFGACNKSDLNNKLLHFQSTNFGKAFVELIKYTTAKKATTDVFVISFQNVDVTAELIIKSKYKKIYVVCASFYDCIALEDMILGGFLISSLKVELENLDDEALTMYACYKTFNGNKNIFESCWTGSVLKRLSKQEDINDIIELKRIPKSYSETMKKLILKVEFHDNVPIIVEHNTFQFDI